MFSRLKLSALALACAGPLSAWSQISLSINIGPPPLPVYVQPVVPGEGYVWTPGYWAWSPAVNDYYWIPGTWVLAPQVGYLWTPGYWAFDAGLYRWHLGYWADRVGFYGGVNYGYGYSGVGYQGGRWDRGVFQYNRSVNNINTTVVHNVYNATVVNNYNVTRVSFNGGPGGVTARPSPAEMQVQSARHLAPTPNQVQHERTAMTIPAQRASVNHGTPQLAATPRPAAFNQAPGQPGARNEAAPVRTVPPPRTETRVPPRTAEPGATPAEERRAAPPPREPSQPRSQAQQRPQPQAQPQEAQRRPPQARPEAPPQREQPPRAQAPERAQPGERGESPERPRNER